MKIVREGNTPIKSAFQWDYNKPITCHTCFAIIYLEPTDHVMLRYGGVFDMDVIEFGCPSCGSQITVTEDGYQVRIS
jgi:Zn finger protein HypA/HybF involved in hydrogenase expression